MTSETAEIEDRLLSELHESGEEELVTLLNTVFDCTGEVSERTAFCLAMISLIETGAIAVARESEGRPLKEMPRSRSIEQVKLAISALMFDIGERYWIDPQMTFDVYAVVSSAGSERAHRILSERGYQWWRRPEPCAK